MAGRSGVLGRFHRGAPALFGLGATLDVAVLSVVLVVLYVKTRSLWPAMVFHGINDAFGFLGAPAVPR